MSSKDSIMVAGKELILGLNPKYTDDSMHLDASKLDEQQFRHAVIEKRSLKFEKYKTEWNDDIGGYIVTFEDGYAVHTKIVTYWSGKQYLERYNLHEEDEITEEQEDYVNDFIAMVDEVLSLVKMNLDN
jgi:hypothetical protein